MFKGKEVSIPTVASELGVGTVLEGSIRKAGDNWLNGRWARMRKSRWFFTTLRVFTR